MEDEKTIKEKLNEELERVICEITEEGINCDNVKYLGEVVDIHKDLVEEDYRKEKMENMRYANYGDDMSYGRGRRRDSRGRFMESGNYGTYGRGRGRSRGSYGHKYIDDMDMMYGTYSESKERYGSDDATMRSLEEMLSSVEKFMKHLESEAGSEEEMELIKETAERIAR